MIPTSLRSSFSLLILLVATLYAAAEQTGQEMGLSDASAESSPHSVHLAKKRSVGLDSAEPGDIGDALVLDPDTPYIPEDDVSDDKRSSLFRFGKRQFRYGKRQFRYGKRQFRYGKRQFRYGKRDALLDAEKRGGGTLFRFGKRAEDARRLVMAQRALEELLAREAELEKEGVAKRGFHWGSDE